MIQIYLKNIQAIGEYRFDFPDNGIVQFFGDNSNGKSILGKVMSAVVFQKLKHDDERLPLINDQSTDALFGIQYNNKSLIVLIDRIMDKCIYQLVREDGSQVVRKLLDNGIDEILREFGFLIYDKRQICLQFCETFGAMPFVNTSDVANGEIVNSVITDIPSEQFLESYKATFNEAKMLMKQYNSEIDSYNNRLNMIKPINTDGLSDLAKRLKAHYYKNRMFPAVKEIDLEFLPVLNFDMSYVKEIEDLYPPYFIDYEAKEISNLDYILNTLDKLDKGVCPTCGKRFLGGNHVKCD